MIYENSSTNRAVVIQGGQYTFERSLLVTTGGDPADPDGYPATTDEPSVTVYDPDGTPIAAGVGTRVSQGVYNYLFTCPLGAIVSDGWYLQFGATISGDYHLWREYFRVVDRSADAPSVADPNQLSSLKTDEYVLALRGRDERVYLETRAGRDLVQPLTTPTLGVYDVGETLLASPTVTQVPGRPGIYYADLSGTTLLTQLNAYYMLVWSYALTVGAPSRTVIQMLWTAPLSIFRLLPDLRSLIDKAQKPTDRIQGYSDQELARYIRHGLNVFNMRPPVTGFTLTTTPEMAEPWVLTCAMLYGLQAQMLQEIDQEFEVTGQTISIRWDHFANLNSFVQQAAQQWQDQGEKIKIALGLGKGRLFVRPAVQGYIGIARRQASEGTFFAAYKI